MYVPTITTTTTTTTTTSTIRILTHHLQQLQEGPIKDRARLERRAYNSKQQANLEEYEEQKRLFKEMEKSQPLTGEIVQGIDKK